MLMRQNCHKNIKLKYELCNACLLCFGVCGVANGSGQSKKKAKHAAAKAVLDIIIQGGAAGAGGPTPGGAPGAAPEL